MTIDIIIIFIIEINLFLKLSATFILQPLTVTVTPEKTKLLYIKKVNIKMCIGYYYNKYNLRKQPPRPINEISVREGVYLPGKCLCVRGIGAPGKLYVYED